MWNTSFPVEISILIDPKNKFQSFQKVKIKKKKISPLPPATFGLVCLLACTRLFLFLFFFFLVWALRIGGSCHQLLTLLTLKSTTSMPPHHNAPLQHAHMTSQIHITQKRSFTYIPSWFFNLQINKCNYWKKHYLATCHLWPSCLLACKRLFLFLSFSFFFLVWALRIGGSCHQLLTLLTLKSTTSTPAHHNKSLQHAHMTSQIHITQKRSYTYIPSWFFNLQINKCNYWKRHYLATCHLWPSCLLACLLARDFSFSFLCFFFFAGGVAMVLQHNCFFFFLMWALRIGGSCHQLLTLLTLKSTTSTPAHHNAPLQHAHMTSQIHIMQKRSFTSIPSWFFNLQINKYNYWKRQYFLN